MHKSVENNDYSSHDASPNKIVYQNNSKLAHQKALKKQSSKENLQYSQVEQQYDMNQQQLQQLKLKENQGKNKPPMHQQVGYSKQRKMEHMMYNQGHDMNQGMLPHVGSNSELSG